MKKKKSSLKLKIESLNERNYLLGGTDGANTGNPDTTTKGAPKSKDDAACASKVVVLTVCTEVSNTNNPQTDP
ncbi:hypothetical protein [Kordia zhangzhouensis]|uniref:hypothetical protein n=1 Tax=Kordia zhangzhouensis TaxID=1620405 RepID=UPI000629219C|nr:hypothetical protein [Kordia zhangzhouensis]